MELANCFSILILCASFCLVILSFNTARGWWKGTEGWLACFFTSREQDVSQGQGKARKGAHQRRDTYHYQTVSHRTKMLYSSIVGDEATADAASQEWLWWPRMTLLFNFHNSEPYLPCPLTMGHISYHNFPQLRQSKVMWLQAKTSKARREENKNINLYNQHYMLCTLEIARLEVARQMCLSQYNWQGTVLIFIKHSS